MPLHSFGRTRRELDFHVRNITERKSPSAAPLLPCWLRQNNTKNQRLSRRKSAMELDTLKDLYVDELKDLYSAEKQLVKALPKMAKAANDPQLKEAFRTHLE